jgi:hypothetical protein
MEQHCAHTTILVKKIVRFEMDIKKEINIFHIVKIKKYVGSLISKKIHISKKIIFFMVKNTI